MATTITAQSIVDKAQIPLQDTTGVRWPDAELLGWLNDGQREIVVLKPNAFVINTTMKLAAGTKQGLPSNAAQLIDIVRNMGESGSTPGRPIRITDQKIMDAQVPNWHQQTASAEVKHFMYSVLDPKHFYVYPPQPTVNQNYVEIVYGAIPDDAVLASVISLDDIYQNALLDYILFRAFSKESELADQTKAGLHQQNYIASLTGKIKSEIGASPNTHLSTTAK
ncbi:MAG: hypothetical protein HRU77_01500 [Gammaproteobacteria bacterium]|nr:MAG: hypothetical protein HRU77_01500 [Gammaproteobacteria bacterium]